jgi:hypothetical protein
MQQGPLAPHRDESIRSSLRAEVLELLEAVARYEKNASYDTGEAIRTIVLVKPHRTGAVPALHARWQAEGHVHNLNTVESELLARAGYRIMRDSVGYYAFWRDRHVTHLWVAIKNQQWSYSHSPRLRGAKFMVASDIRNLELPLFAGYLATPETVLRESLISALPTFYRECPEFIHCDPKFLQVLRALCDHELEYLRNNHWLLNTLKVIPKTLDEEATSEPYDDRDRGPSGSDGV